MMKDVTMELAQILMVKVCHQGVVIFSKIPPLTTKCYKRRYFAYFCKVSTVKLFPKAD